MDESKKNRLAQLHAEISARVVEALELDPDRIAPPPGWVEGFREGLAAARAAIKDLER